MWKVSRMRMKFELDNSIPSQVHRETALGVVILQLVLGRIREWDRSLRTKIYVKFLCIFSFECIIVSSGKVERALLLPLLFPGYISQNT